MPRLADVMTRRVLTLSPELSLRDALEQLTNAVVSSAPVVSGGVIVGTLSANDLLAFLATTPAVPGSRPGSDGWRDEIFEPDDEGGAPSIYFTDLWDDAGASAAGRFDAEASPEWDVLAEHTVAEAMSTEFVTLPAGAPLDAAAQLMKRTGAHRVIVTDNRRVIGIVTTMDVTRAFADGARRAAVL